MTTFTYGGDPTGLTGKFHYGMGSLGIRGDEVPLTGEHGPGYIGSCLDLPTDDANEFYGLITSVPAGLTFTSVDENSGFSATAASPGIYVVPFDLYKFGEYQFSDTFSLPFGDTQILDIVATLTTGAPTSGSGNITVTPPEPGIINLAGSNTLGNGLSSTDSVTVEPPIPNIINLAGGNTVGAGISGVGVIDIWNSTDVIPTSQLYILPVENRIWKA